MAVAVESSSVDLSDFAQTIYHQKNYSHELPDGSRERWEDTAARVTHHVLDALGYGPDSYEYTRTYELIRDRKFIPGGRYLYATGRELHQTQNCFSGQTRFLTDKGVASLEESVGPVRIRNRFGEWEDAKVQCFGEQEIYNLHLANGDTIETTANHLWWQADGSRCTTEEVGTIPLSKVAQVPELDREGIRHGIVYGDGHLVKDRYAQIVFVNPDKDESLAQYFVDEEREVTVGFGAKLAVRTVRSTKRGTIVSLQPRHYKALPLVYTPEYARGFIAGLIAADGCASKGGSVTISHEGLDESKRIAEIAVAAGCVVTSVRRVVSRVSPFDGSLRELCLVSMKPFSAPLILPAHQENAEGRNFRRNRLMRLDVDGVAPTGRFEPVYCVVAPESESFTLANGLITSNCVLFRAEDSREGWANLAHRCAMSLMTGAGVGVVYSDLREKGAFIKKTGGVASGPLSLMQMINEMGRHIMQGGTRRSAIWAGLHWNHPDVFEFIRMKDWSKEVRALKEDDYDFPATMDTTNVSVILDTEFFEAYDSPKHPLHSLAYDVYHQGVARMIKTGEPGFSIDAYENEGENLRNACCEITSHDDSDVCNLGSVNMGRIETLDEFQEAVKLGTLFLLAGTEYSDVPTDKIAEVRAKNRRLGLGLMGVHDWLLQRGHRYEFNDEFREWVTEYKYVSDESACIYADLHGLSRPIGRRAIAPNGSISYMGDTTPSAEPIPAVAYIRSWIEGSDTRKRRYIIDPIARKLIEENGIDPMDIEDAHTLAYDFERRIKFQADLQDYVDHAISSTVNLPAPITQPDEVKYFADTLYKYLPRLRGITCYPDGARGGQPFTPVPYEVAIEKEGVIIEGDEEAVCKGGACGV